MDDGQTSKWIAERLAKIDQTSKIGREANSSYLYPEYRDNLLGFIAEVIGDVTYDREFDHKAALWEGQRAIIHSMEDFKRTAVFSARGHGKDHCLARAMLAVFYTRPARILCLAPSLRQLQNILFSEVSKVFHGSKIKLEGELLSIKLKLKDDPSRYILGIPAGDPDRVRGFHAGVDAPGDPDRDMLTEEDMRRIEEFLLEGGDEEEEIWICVDEPEGVAESVFAALEGTLSKTRARVVLIGNPAQGLYDEHTYPRALMDETGAWNCINLSSIPHSEYPGQNEDQLSRFDAIYDAPPGWLIPHESRATATATYDSSDPVFLSDWRGLFSESMGDSQVIPHKALQLSAERFEENTQRNQIGPRIGIDLGFGGDMTVATLMVNGVVRDVVSWRDASDDKTMQVTISNKIIALCSDWGHAVYESWPETWDGGAIVGGRLSIDQTGMPGVADILSAKGIECDRVNFGAAFRGDQLGEADYSIKFQNNRAGMYWSARQGLQSGLFHIPFSSKYATLREQIKWTLYERDYDLIKLEKKSKIIERHGNSPDYADAFVMACRPSVDSPAIWTTGGPLLTPTRNLLVPGDVSRKSTRRDSRQWTRL